MYDTLICNGLIPDFDADALLPREVALEDGKIAAVLPAGSRPPARTVVDAAGKVVSPGFIDLHMHEESFPGDDHRYTVAQLMVRQGVTTAVGGNCGEQPSSLARFSAIVAEQGGSPVNYVLLAGYNSLREQCGLGWYDPATPEQCSQLHALLRREMEAGAWGVSFGLEYAPGISYEEMKAAVESIRDFDPFVSIHFRSDCEGCLPSIEEMIRLSRETGCRVQLSHLSSLAGTAGNMPAALSLLTRAIAENDRFGFDTYPYPAFSTGIGTAVFDMDWREKWGVGYDAVQLLHPLYTGMRCTKELFETVRRETPEARVVVFAMDEGSIRDAVACPAGLLGSDGILDETGEGHPRAAGTFPRILGKYVREEGALSLMEALDKMTRRAARRIGLPRKGEIKVGFDADLTIFDPATIADGATFTDFHRPNTGIEAVYVAGSNVIDSECGYSTLPGRVIKRV